MQQLKPLTDPVYNETVVHSGTDSFFLSLINDKRDLPFVYLTIKIIAVMIPVGLVMYIPGLPVWLFAIASVLYFYLNNFVFKGPFGLMLHCTSHRTLYKKKYAFLNQVLPWFVGPFFGQTPETYSAIIYGCTTPKITWKRTKVPPCLTSATALRTL